MGQAASGASSCCSSDKQDRDFLLEPGRATASDEVVSPEPQSSVKTLTSNVGLSLKEKPQAVEAMMTRQASPKRLRARGGLSNEEGSVGGPLATVLSDEESEDPDPRPPERPEVSLLSRAASRASSRLFLKDTDSQPDSAGARKVLASPDRWGASSGGQSIPSKRRSDGSDGGGKSTPRTPAEDLNWKKSPKEAARAAMRIMSMGFFGGGSQMDLGGHGIEGDHDFVVELLEVALAVCCASAGDFVALGRSATKDERKALRKLAEFARKHGFLTDDNMLFSGSITLKELAGAFLNTREEEPPPATLGMKRGESTLGIRRGRDSEGNGPSAGMPTATSLNFGLSKSTSKNLSQHLLSRTYSDISATSFTDFNKKYARARSRQSLRTEDDSAPSLLEYLSAMAASLGKKPTEVPTFTEGREKQLMLDFQLPTSSMSSPTGVTGTRSGDARMTWANSFQSIGGESYHSAADLVIQGEGEEKEIVHAEIMDLGEQGSGHVRVAFRSRCLRTQNEWQRHLLAQQRSLLKLAKQRKLAAEQQLKQGEEVKEEQKELLRGFRKIIQRDVGDQRLNRRASVVVVEEREELRNEVEGLCKILEYPCKSFKNISTAKAEVASPLRRPFPGQQQQQQQPQFVMDRRATPQLLAGRPGDDFQDWRAGSPAAPGEKAKTVQEVQMRVLLLGHTWLERELPSSWREDEDIVIVLTSEAEEFEEVGRALLAAGEAEIRERLREKGISDYLLHPLSLESLQETISQAIHRRFGEEYLLLDALGRGGSGVVHQAKRLKDGAAFALKEIPTRRLSKAAKEDVERETRLLQELKWPTVVFVVDTWENKQAHLRFLLMPLLKGGSVLNCTEAARESGAPHSRERVGGWYAQTLHGLAYLHWRGVLHRDLKPGNLLLAEDCEALQIADLGSAALLPGPGPHPAKRSRVKSQVTTPAYGSPEVYGEGCFMAPSDIWSVGVSFYEVATLTQLFSGENSKRFQELICGFDAEQQADEAVAKAAATLKDCGVGPIASELMEMLRRDPLRRPTAAALTARPSTAHRLRNVLTKWALQRGEVKQHFATFDRVVRESEAASELPGQEEPEPPPAPPPARRKPLRPGS